MKWLGTSITTKLVSRAAIALVAGSVSATWCLVAMTNAGHVTNETNNVAVPDAPAVTPFADIFSIGPLTHVWLGNELSCQVQHIADGTVHEFYPDDTIPGDSGTFIAMDWAEGFLQAIMLRADAWKPLFTSKQDGKLLFPVLSLCCDKNGDSLLGLSPEA